ERIASLESNAASALASTLAAFASALASAARTLIKRAADDLDIGGHVGFFFLGLFGRIGLAGLAALAETTKAAALLVVNGVAFHLGDLCRELISHDIADQSQHADCCERKLLHGGCS